MPECRHEIQKFLLIILIRNTARYGAKTLPLIFIFIKENHTIISVFQSINALLLILQII